MDHGPPPPYSVTDLYSNSGSRSSGQPHAVLTTTTSNSDNASLPGRPISEYDAASSTGDPTIVTPPYTPDDDRSTHLEPVVDNVKNPSSTPSVAAASESAYFESRPVNHLFTDVLLIHDMVIENNAQPSEIPFPKPEEKWLERDVLPQDWKTFLNYLLPHHSDASNQGVAERKLKEELVDERMHRLTLADNDVSRTDLRQVDAQLAPLRRSQTEQGVDRDIHAVVNAWNQGFFGPRNIFIEVSEPQPDDYARTVPGSWNDDLADVAANGQSQVPPCGSRGGFGGGFIRAGNRGFHVGRNMISADSNGFRMGRNGLVADSNGFRIGNLLVADGQGFKFGPFQADANGFRIGRGNPLPQGHHRGYHPERHSVHMPPSHRGRPSTREYSPRMPHRDRSHSISSSSSSGASSLESAGSLPDYDHLKDSQLPVAKQTVQDWLNHPDQPITKQTVKQIREEIKLAKSKDLVLIEPDRDALRKEVRDLFKEFKLVKKTQKKTWKAAKRERKSLRREANRSRRSAWREVKQADKEVRNAEKETRKAQKKEIKAGKLPEIPTIPVPPGAWPLDNNGNQEAAPPSAFMPPLSSPHYMPHMGPPIGGRGWPFMESPQAGNPARAALLQAEGQRIEAEAKREAALRRAEATRQKAQDQSSAARSLAEEGRKEAEAKAAAAQEKAQAAATLARAKAERNRQRAEANARVARQKAEANHIAADSKKMLVDVNRMRTQAEQLEDKSRMKLLDIAEKLEEEAEKLKREGERLLAEAVQSAEDVASAFRNTESQN